MGGIYLYKNNITNQVYIGQALDLNQRYNAHKSAIHNKESKEYDSCISQAFREYGFENFSYEILAKNIENKELLSLLENYYISFYNSTYPNGYNKTYGGKMYFSFSFKRVFLLKKRLLILEKHIKIKKSLLSYIKNIKTKLHGAVLSIFGEEPVIPI